MGAPSSFTQEIADKICLGLMEGRSLRGVLLDDEMPAMSSVFKWLNENKAFSEQYARAREVQAEVLADEIQEIADTPQEGEVITDSSKDGVTIKRGDMLEHRRLRIDARKWFASKVAPKKYGDKITQELTGKDGVEPIQVVIQSLPRRKGEEIRPDFTD